jgi:hypothetical protein
MIAMAKHKSFASFAKAIFLRADEVEKNSEEMIQKATIAALISIVQATPADSGRARSNWNVSLGQADLSTKEPYAPGENLGLGEAQNSQAAISQGTQQALQYRRGRGGNYLTNNLPYIKRLNDGHSEQAPAGFFKYGIKSARDTIRQLKLLRKR